MTHLSVVLLPAPLTPMKPVMLPAGTWNETPFRTSRDPKRLATSWSCNKGWGAGAGMLHP